MKTNLKPVKTKMNKVTNRGRLTSDTALRALVYYSRAVRECRAIKEPELESQYQSELDRIYQSSPPPVIATFKVVRDQLGRWEGNFPSEFKPYPILSTAFGGVVIQFISTAEVVAKARDLANAAGVSYQVWVHQTIERVIENEPTPAKFVIRKKD